MSGGPGDFWECLLQGMAHNDSIIVKKACWGLTSEQGVLVNGDVAFSNRR